MSAENGISGLAEIELKIAFRLPGCPICRVKQQSARRYLDFLLWENVNDMATRIHVVRSLGYCSEHTWQLYHLEMNRFGDGLGVSIIYEDLTHHIGAGLCKFLAQLPASAPSKRPWWAKVWARLGAVLGGHPPVAASMPDDLVPREECRVCSIARQSEQNATQSLIKGCTHSAFRDWYAASDGICVTHLRQALEAAAQIDAGAARFLTDNAAKRLASLATDLSEYSRKRSWQYRHEALSDGEQDAPRRASQFFGGPDG